MPTDIYTLGISVDSTDVVDADQDLDNLANAASNASNEVQDLGIKSQVAGRKTKAMSTSASAASPKVKGMGRNAGQAGIQIQQMVGQIQGGQSAFVALSQQAADLGIVLGAPLVGVIVSLGAVLAGTLVAALKGTSEEVEELINDFDDLSDRFESISLTQLNALIIQTEKEIDSLKAAGAITSDVVSEFDKLNNAFGVMEPSFLSQNKGWDDLDNALTTGKSARISAGDELNQLEKDLVGYRKQLELLLAVSPEDVDFTNSILPSAGDINKRRFVLQGELDAWDAYIRQQTADRTESLRQEYINRPWLVGIAAIDDVNRWLDENKLAKDAADADELEKAQAQADAIKAINEQRFSDALALTNATTGLFSQLYENKIQGEINALKETEGLTKEEVAIREQQAKELFEKQKSFQKGMIGINTAAAVMNELATNPDPYGKWLSVGTIVATGATQAAAIDGQQFGGGFSVPDVATPETSSTTNNNVQNTFNISGGNAESIASQIQELFDSGEMSIKNGSVISV